MVTRAYPDEYLQSQQPSTPPSTTIQQYYYIPREYWYILGIAIAGLVIALLLAIYELGKD